MSLRPENTIQKALLSTTSRLVGEYESGGVLLTHAWPDFLDRTASARWSEGPASRSAFILAFETEPLEKKAGPIPNYSPTGEMVCAYLAVLFGKRFDSHGLVEGNGFFHIPELSQFGNLCNPRIPHNSHGTRVDFSVPLNLSEVRRIESLLHDASLDTKFLRTFQGATKFYLQAIQNAEHDAEVSYLHLITACEILSNFHEYEKGKLLDEETKDVLSVIRDTLTDGEKIANIISGKLLLVKKRFVETIVSLVDQDFFQRSEANEPFAGFKADSFRACISAAYDLRSRYVHTGIPFGSWISLSTGGMNNEIQIGQPIVEDKELGAILAKAPTYIGLERVVRYCLLQFAKSHGAYVEPAVASIVDAQPIVPGDAPR
jgi:hypothetical protein